MDIKKKSKEFLIKLQNLPDQQKKIILWTIVAILAIIMGFFWVKSAINNFSKIGESVQNIKFSQIGQTADWQTYTNSEFGFELKHPQDWEVKYKPSKSGNVFVSEIIVQKIGEELSENNSSILILPEGFTTSGFDGINLQEQEGSFAGRKATIIRYLTEEGDIFMEDILEISDLPQNWSKYSYLTIRYKTYNLTWECAIQPLSNDECDYGMGRKFFGKVDQEEKEIIQKILSTFKFTVPADQTVEWKTYTNINYGFEIRIPSDWIVKEDSGVLTFTTEDLLKQQAQNRINCKQGKDCDPGELPYAIGYFKYIEKDGDEYSTDELQIGISTVELNNKTWHRYELGGMLSNIHFRIVDDKSKGYDFGVYMDTDENIMKAVLSTFKFINK